MKGQMSLDLILVILALVVFLSVFQFISTQISFNAVKISARDQVKTIASDIAGLMEAIPSNGATTITNHKIPFISLKEKKASCTISIKTNKVNISMDENIEGQTISIEESIIVLNEKTNNLIIDANCGETINMST